MTHTANISSALVLHHPTSYALSLQILQYEHRIHNKQHLRILNHRRAKEKNGTHLRKHICSLAQQKSNCLGTVNFLGVFFYCHVQWGSCKEQHITSDCNEFIFLNCTKIQILSNICDEKKSIHSPPPPSKYLFNLLYIFGATMCPSSELLYLCDTGILHSVWVAVWSDAADQTATHTE